ncbi:MAG: DNA-directed RNA polymerase subunit delta [Chloroflexota bacterium]
MAKATPAIDPNLPVAEIAFRILSKHGTPMEWSELLDAVAAIKKPGAEQNDGIRARAGMYTEINLDNRFNYVGDGLWGLRDWAPKGAATRAVPLATSLRSRREKIHRDEEIIVTDDDDDESPRADEIDQLRRDDEGEEDEWDDPEEA